MGNDNILGRDTNLVTAANDFEDVTISDFVGAVAVDRNAGPNNAASPVAYYAVHENTGSGNPATLFPNSKLYRANITTGAVENGTSDTGFGNIQCRGVTYANATITRQKQRDARCQQRHYGAGSCPRQQWQRHHDRD